MAKHGADFEGDKPKHGGTSGARLKSARTAPNSGHLEGQKDTIPEGVSLQGEKGISQNHTGGSQAGTPGHKSGSKSPGLARILAPEKNEDEFAKGTVAAPQELDDIRQSSGQNNEGMGADGEQSLLYGGGLFERERPGLEDGVSVRLSIDPDSTEPNYNYDIDPLTGNAPERKVGRANNYLVKGKRGNKFLVGEM